MSLPVAEGGAGAARGRVDSAGMRLARAVLLAPLLLLAACGDDDPTSQEEFASRYADLICPRLSPCCQATGQSNDVSACKRFIKLLSGTSSGTKFNQDAADACLAALADWSCTEQEPDVCDNVLSGTVAPGGSCDSNTDCAAPVEGGVTCQIDYGSGTSKGTCKVEPVPAAGQPCGAESSTATEHFVCDQDPAFFCDSGTCKARAAVGEACEGYGACLPDAYCDTSGASWTCVGLSKVGESCGVGCVEGAYCGPDGCTKKKAMGEPCQSWDECEGSCDTASGKCRPSATICFSND